jgi:hypothetical protein
MYGHNADRVVTLSGSETFTLTSMSADEIPAWVPDAMPCAPGRFVVVALPTAGWSVRDQHGALVGFIFKRGSQVHAEYVSQRDGDWYAARPHRNRFDAAVAAIWRGRTDETYRMNDRAEPAPQQGPRLGATPGDFDAQAPNLQMSLFHEPDRYGTPDLFGEIGA